MGHDIHFLSRLERLSLPHVELAMSLYNDTPLLQYILSALNLPEGAERIALSLKDSTKGPFLVVQRDGHFVTCLGEGMAPVGLHVVPRSHVEALSQRIEELRSRMEMARQQVGPRGRAMDVFRPLFTAGPLLSREEFLAAAAWAPLMIKTIFAVIADSHVSQIDTYYALRTRQKRRVAGPGMLRAYWNSIWALGHFILLVGMEGRALCAAMAENDQAGAVMAKLSWPAIFPGICGPALRGAWAIGKLGKVALPSYKAEYARGGNDLAFYAAVLSLFSIGARHKGLRGEIRKTLERTDPRQGPAPHGLLYQHASPLLLQLYSANMQTADEHRETLTRCGQDIYVDRVQRFLPPDSAFRYPDASAVPPEFAAPAVAMLPASILIKPEDFATMIMLNVWLAGLEAEALYFPRRFLQELRLPFDPGLIDMQVEQTQKLYGETTPARAQPTPGRNDPCSCGSNVKYKKCCARTGEAQKDATH